jgi:probable rRNA maturation factor
MKDPDHPEPSPDLIQFLRYAQGCIGLPGEVNVRITSDSEMRRLNRRYRGKDKATDVLSFPPFQNGTKPLAGDIAVSADIARANSIDLGHSFDDEVKILLLHGLLHLAGHDHESDNGEMSRLEQKLRAKLKLPPGLIERAKSKGPTAAPGRVFRKTSKNATANQTAKKLSHRRKELTSAAKAAPVGPDLPTRLKVVPFPKTNNGNKLLGNSTKNPAEGGRRSFRSVRSS